MSNINRKIKRNLIKNSLKRQKNKITKPLSNYRNLTEKEKKEMYANKIVDMMIENVKKDFRF